MLLLEKIDGPRYKRNMAMRSERSQWRPEKVYVSQWCHSFSVTHHYSQIIPGQSSTIGLIPINLKLFSSHSFLVWPSDPDKHGGCPPPALLILGYMHPFKNLTLGLGLRVNPSDAIYEVVTGNILHGCCRKLFLMSIFYVFTRLFVSYGYRCDIYDQV